MKEGGKSRKLLKELTRDARLKKVIAQARGQSRRNSRAKVENVVENVTDMFLLLLTMASRFSKKKKARALDELADTVYLLVQASLLLKENIFDRPEVKEFFSKSSRQLYSFAQGCVAMVLPRPKGLRQSSSAGHSQ